MPTYQAKATFFDAMREFYRSDAFLSTRMYFIILFCVVEILRWVMPNSSSNPLVILPLSMILAAAIVFPVSLGWRRQISRKYSGRTLLVVNMSMEANNVLKSLAERSGGDESDVLRKSLALMELSMKAHERGLAVGATTQPETLETEFTGFEADLDGRIAQEAQSR